LKDFTVVDAIDQLVNGGGLVACWQVGLKQLEGRTGVADEGSHLLGV
jgi:hypothetical protein